MLPLGEKLVLALLGVLCQRRVLQVLQVVVLPVHENVGLFGPALELMVVDRFFADGHLVQDVGVEDVVFAERRVLSEDLRVVIKHLFQGLAEHGSLG